MNSKIILQLITFAVFIVQSLQTPFKDCGKCEDDN